MKRRTLFLSRKCSGMGGLQKLHRDLWIVMRGTLPRPWRVCPWSRFDITFPIRALLAGIFAAIRGDRIHLGDAAIAPLGVFFSRFFRARVSLTTCGLDLVWPSKFYQRVLRESLPCVSLVHCISVATEAEARRRGATRTIVLPCGIDVRDLAIRRARFASQAPVLITVARLIERKGIAWFLREVYPRLQMIYPKITYKIIGIGEQENLIKKIIQEKSETSVILLGEVSDPERDRHLLEADLFVMPNISVPGDMEGFGIACIEAAVRGLPVAASFLQGLRDAVIDGVTGGFFAPSDPEDAERVIRELLRSPPDPRAVAAAACARYSWDILAPRYRDALFS